MSLSNKVSPVLSLLRQSLAPASSRALSTASARGPLAFSFSFKQATSSRSMATVGLGTALAAGAISRKPVYCAADNKAPSVQDALNAAAAAASGSSEGNNNKKEAGGFSAISGYFAGEISAASILGFCAGVYLKKTSEQIAYYIGMGVLIFQALAYLGYVSVSWNKIQEDLKKVADADGDGKITSNDFKIISKKFFSVVTTKMVSGAGFSAGFWLGFRYF